MAPGSNGIRIPQLGRSAKCLHKILRGRKLRGEMNICTNHKAVGHCMGHLEPQESYSLRHRQPQKNGNPISHQHKSIPTLQKRNLRIPHKIPLPFFNIHTLLSLPFFQILSWIAAVSSTRQCSQINPDKMNNLLDID